MVQNLAYTSTLTISSKIYSFISANFHLSILPYLFRKPSLQSSLKLPFSIPRQFFTSLFSSTGISRIPKQSVFSEDWLCLNLCLFPWSMDKKSKVHNHFFYIAQAQTIGVLHVVVSPPSLSLPIPLSYCHYFPTLLIPWQELKFPWKPVASLDFHPMFSILIYYLYPFLPICF